MVMRAESASMPRRRLSSVAIRKARFSAISSQMAGISVVIASSMRWFASRAVKRRDSLSSFSTSVPRGMRTIASRTMPESVTTTHSAFSSDTGTSCTCLILTACSCGEVITDMYCVRLESTQAVCLTTSST